MLNDASLFFAKNILHLLSLNGYKASTRRGGLVWLKMHNV